MSKEIKRGDVVRVKDADGGSTKAKVVAVRGEWVEVRWMEARWNLAANIMSARKGTKDEVFISEIL